MAEYTRREVHTVRVDYLVPARWPYGACWTEVQKAIAAALQELRECGQLGASETPADDRIRIRPGDEDIAVSFEVTEARTEERVS